jgi:uncharacterized protein YjdB
METQSKKSFFATLPGILTGLAALIAAVTGLYIAFHDREQTTPGPDEYVQPPAASVQLQPAQSNISVGGTLQLRSNVRDSNGNLLHGRPIDWSCSDNTIASVSQTGVVRGLKAGSVTVTAASEGVTGAAVVGVKPEQVASVQVLPIQSNISVGATLQL